MIQAFVSTAVFLALVIGWRLEAFEGLPGVRGLQRACAWTFAMCCLLFGAAAAEGTTRFVNSVVSEIQADVGPFVDSVFDDLVPTTSTPGENP